MFQGVLNVTALRVVSFGRRRNDSFLDPDCWRFDCLFARDVEIVSVSKNWFLNTLSRNKENF